MVSALAFAAALCACGASSRAPQAARTHATTTAAHADPAATGRASLQGAAPADVPAVAPAGPQDLRLTLASSASTVAPDGVVWLEARVTNTTGHPLALNVAIPESIEATNELGARNPAPGPGSGRVDAQCRAVDCVATPGSIPRAVTLAPGESMKASFPWKAAREVIGGGACCPEPVRVGPLPAGKYTLSLDISVEGLPVLVSSTKVTVKP
jgi:hypothetical protein